MKVRLLGSWVLRDAVVRSRRDKPQSRLKFPNHTKQFSLCGETNTKETVQNIFGVVGDLMHLHEHQDELPMFQQFYQ